jgi:hypothetical protein
MRTNLFGCEFGYGVAALCADSVSFPLDVEGILYGELESEIGMRKPK